MTGRAAERTIRPGRGSAATMSFSFLENGRPLLVTVDTIVSEYHDDRDPIVARLMERFYFGYN